MNNDNTVINNGIVTTIDTVDENVIEETNTNTSEKIVKTVNDSQENVNNRIKFFDDFDFNTLPNDVLTLALKTINHPDAKIAYEYTNETVKLNNNIFRFCDFIEEDFDLDSISKTLQGISNCIDDDGEIKFKGKDYFSNSKNTIDLNTVDGLCYNLNCQYSRCPKGVIGYVKYLKDIGELEQKLKEREEYLKNKKSNNFFTFEWNLKDGLKYIPKDIFEISLKLVELGFINVERNLNKKNRVTIHCPIACHDNYQYTLETKEDVENILFLKNNKMRYWTRDINQELLNCYCSSYHCRKKACYLAVAGYIYYLIMSGQSEKITEDRKYYNENEESINEYLLKFFESQIGELKDNETDLYDYINGQFDDFQHNVKNLKTLSNILNNPTQKNLYCAISSEEGLSQDELILNILKILRKSKKIKTETVKKVREEKIEIPKANPEDETQYEIKEIVEVVELGEDEYKEEISLSALMEKSIGTTGTSEESYYNLIYNPTKQNRLYVVNQIQDFINEYNTFKDASNKDSYANIRKKQISSAINTLTSLKENTFIILVGTEDEIQSLFDLDNRFKHLFQECYLSIKSLTLDGMFNAFKKSLDLKLFYKLLIIGEDEFKKQFIEFISINKKLLPFKNLDLAKYLAMYVNTKKDLVLPANLYERQTLEEALGGIIGLDLIKNKIYDFEQYVLFGNKAKTYGLKLPNHNMHMVFTGNPGTGKTTVARIIAKMLYDIGILKENKLVEVDRKDLIAEYIGQTAPKTYEVIEKALGGVLFIDEAYALTPSDSFRDYGQEAVATLIKAMEDKKDNLVVIFAGYKNEMKHFVESNPGIASRIGYTFNFEDYSEDELLEIFKIKMKASGFIVNEDVNSLVYELIKFFIDVKNFGNGRFVDKVIQEMLIKHAKNATSDNINIIEKIDVPTIQEMLTIIFNGDMMDNPKDISEDIQKITAYHEIGHAFVYYKLFGTSNIKNITIEPNASGRLGEVIQSEEKTYVSRTKEYFLNRIRISLAGIAAEELFFGEFDDGGVSDLKNATEICHVLISKCGMSSLGLAYIDERYNMNSELTKSIQDEVNRILEQCFKDVKNILKNHEKEIHFLANELFKNKSLSKEEFDELLNQIDTKTFKLKKFLS